MNDADEKQKLSFIKRRLVLVKFFYFFLTLILILRLFKLQILDYLFYKKKSKNNYLRKKFILPKRGIIFDRNMIKICDTKIDYKVLYFFKKKSDILDIKNIYDLLDRDKKEVELNIKLINKKKTKNMLVLARNLSSNEIKRVKFNCVYFPNMKIEDYYVRAYPFKNYTSALIGYVSAEQRFGADFKKGASGLEKIMNNVITGHVGLKYNIVNSVGKKIDEILVDKPIDGINIVTSIDQNLQNKLSDLFKNKNGAASLIDVRTGGVLAMVSGPSIDPNLISTSISNNEWKKITEKKSKFDSGLLINKNISALYSPGSTFKIVSALAGVVNGIDPKKKYRCTGRYKIGNRTFTCWNENKGGHGLVDMSKAIEKSCNCYFYHLSQQINSKDIYDAAKKLGLRDVHLKNFEGEKNGIVGNSEWLQKKYNKKWRPGDSANLAIGQGYTSLTPLQLATMISRIATNREVEPKYLLSEENEEFDKLDYDEKKLKIIRKALFNAVNDTKNNAFSQFVKKKYQICGKTGTAQVISKKITSNDIMLNKVSVEQYSHALFVGYAPFNNPRYAVSVVVEHGISGAKSAAPIGIQILSEAIKSELD